MISLLQSHMPSNIETIAWCDQKEVEEVIVYKIFLDAESSETMALRQILDPDERSRSSKFKFEEDRTRYIVAHGSLRLILSTYLNLSPSKIAFNFNECGKPFIKDSGLSFNISHSGSFMLCAIGFSRLVGVDIEKIKPIGDLETIARRYFAKSEYEYLSDKNGHSRDQAFYKIWTLKEAYVKAVGKGLSINLNDFAITLNSPSLSHVNNLSEVDRWSLRSLALAPGYAAAIAVEGHHWQLISRDWY